MTMILQNPTLKQAIAEKAKAPSKAVNPTQLSCPAFLMNIPFSLSTEEPNNPWMDDLPPDDRTINQSRAMLQFLQVYRFLSAEAIVYLLPTPRDCRCQDLVYTANMGIVPEHVPNRNTVILSNFASRPRRGETAIGVQFFESMGYDVVVPPYKFEGEAELKHLHDNVYVGGYGTRSEPEVYDWMEKNWGFEIIKIRIQDSYLYHLDCTIFPLTREDCFVCTEMFEPEEIAEIEKATNIIDVSADACYSGICNSVRLSNTIVNSSHIHDLSARSDDYRMELEKNQLLERIAAERAFDVCYFNLSEYHKSGALLSCMVMHLNRHSYGFSLI
jgi:N-dimethylarginine dimethylaminohydrolase